MRQARPFDRGAQDADLPRGVGRIKLGWNNAAKGSERKSPVRLPGFIICTGSVDQDNRPQIDWPSMMALGFGGGKTEDERTKSRRGIFEALASSNPLKFADAFPQDLPVRIGWDAVEVGGAWTFPRTFNDQYSMYDKLGLFCYGDGATAKRRQDDGTRKAIPCRVRGCALAAGEKHCQFSVDKTCKPTGSLVVGLMRFDPKTRYAPIVGGLPNMTWHVETSSEYGLSDVADELRRVADQLRFTRDGKTYAWINNLYGTLSVRTRRHIYRGVNKQSGEAEGKQSITPQLQLSIDPDMVAYRVSYMAEQARLCAGAIESTVRVAAQLAHEAGVPTGDEQLPPEIDDDANRNPDLGHAHDDIIDAKAERVDAVESAAQDDEPPVTIPDFDAMSVEFEDRCNEMSTGQTYDWRDVFEFFAARAGSKTKMRGPATRFFDFAPMLPSGEPNPDANDRYHGRLMYLLAECHRMACVERIAYEAAGTAA